MGETAETIRHPEVIVVWQHYLKRIPSRRQLGPKQRQQIKNALKVRTVDEIKVAINGLAVSPHHNGRNDRQTKYLDLHFAIVPRGAESIEERIDKAMGWAKQYGSKHSSPMMDAHTRDRLLDEIQYTRSFPHRPEQARAEKNRAQLEAAGYRVINTVDRPYARLELKS